MMAVMTDLNGNEVEPDTLYTLATVSIGIRAGQLYDGSEEPLALRAKPSQMLKFLLEHRDSVVSKDELAKAVWPETLATDESISKCISEIRKVLGEDSHSVLETYPKRGYRIHATAEDIPDRSVATRSRSKNLQRWILLVSAPLLVSAGYWAVKTNPLTVDSTQDSSIALTEQNQRRLETIHTASEAAYNALLGARIAVSRFTYKDSLEAQRLFRTAIEHDPSYALAHAELGAAFAIRLENSWTVLTHADEARALFYANEAVRLDPELWMGHYALGRLNAVVTSQDLEAATAHLEKAMSLHPANDDIRVFLAVTQILKGQQTEAIPLLEAALASNPTPPFWYYLSYGHALIQAGHHEDAVAPLLKCLEQMPTSPYCLRFQIAKYALIGRIDDAQWAAEEYGALGFDVTIPAITANTQVQHPDNRALIVRGLRKAGIPE
jgi:DNA-binding winged helix-turn-helix (wHTH) protein